MTEEKEETLVSRRSTEVKNERTKEAASRGIQDYFRRTCGLKLYQIFHLDNYVKVLYQPTDAASIGVARALFGLCMVLDVVEERGLADIDLKWGDPWDCHFPLIHGTKPLSLPWMIVLYTIMWMGAFGIMLGFRFKVACACFVIPYWYIFLLDKSVWNNHTYLYGIVATLFWQTDANKYLALDARKATEKSDTVPYWNYFILKFQFFVLYFLAGLKKSGQEWLDGYAMTNLSRHWVFDPFKLILTTEQTDFFIVHWFAFIFDLSVGFWMLLEKTRLTAMLLCTAFHLMNSRLFSIGMFPYVCLATMPLFCNVDWPRKLVSYAKNSRQTLLIKTYINKLRKRREVRNEESPAESSATKTVKASERNNEPTRVTRKQKCVVWLILCHIILQFFLPYSHFVTKGYNNWVPGLYGYSWDMMVHTWDTVLVVVKVHDNENGLDHYVDPEAWVQNDRWAKHGDMARQYAFCLKENLLRQRKEALASNRRQGDKGKWAKLSSNLSIYVDVWCSLNGRFQQRVFNPKVDMLTVDWHPLKPVSYLMPLLTQYSSYRQTMEEIQRDVYTWSNHTDVLFVADFPQMHLENYISTDFANVTLSVLEGEVAYSEEDEMQNTTVIKDHSISVDTGKFHKIKTTSPYPACYMYTFSNRTRQELELKGVKEAVRVKESLPIIREIRYKIEAWTRAFGHIANAFFNLVYDVPMIRRVRVHR